MDLCKNKHDSDLSFPSEAFLANKRLEGNILYCQVNGIQRKYVLRKKIAKIGDLVIITSPDIIHNDNSPFTKDDIERCYRISSTYEQDALIKAIYTSDKGMQNEMFFRLGKCQYLVLDNIPLDF